MSASTFDQLRLHNPIVAHIMRAGGTAEDCAVALSAHIDRLVERLMTLEGIAPRKIKLPDGRVMVWHCPDRLIPETDMSNAGPHAAAVADSVQADVGRQNQEEA